MARALGRQTRMPELPPDAPLWAVANEARHWSAKDLAPLKEDPRAIASLLGVPPGHQRRLLNDEAPPPHVIASRPLDREDLEARVSAAAHELLGMVLSGIEPVPLFDGRYPERLAAIPDPPLIVYVLGSLPSLERCIAVSGTRTPSAWGARTAERLALGLAKAGWVVTSGLARGIDTRAHRGALAIPRGRTVAVSALPLDRVYPPENIDLARQIAGRGALVSEHGLSRGLGKIEFLRRNRIISGLSFAQFIVETHGSGGSWAQATTALAQDRPLLAIRPPAAETTATHGFKALIDLGAIPVSSVNDAIGRATELWAAEVS